MCVRLQDKIIHKKAYRIAGTIPLSNCISMPSEKGGSLGLTSGPERSRPCSEH